MSCARRKPTVKDRLRGVREAPPGADHAGQRPDAPRRHAGDAQEARDPPARRPPDDLPDADVIVATWWETAEWVWALPASKGVKVHFMQDYEIWGTATPVHRVDATCVLPMPKITPARWVKEMLDKQFGQTDVTLVPNAVDLAKFTAPPRSKQAVPTVGFMYTAFRPKGTDVTIEAIRLARQQRPELQVVAFGALNPTAGDPAAAEGTDLPPAGAGAEAEGAVRAVRRVAVRHAEGRLRPADPRGHGLPHAGHRHAGRRRAGAARTGRRDHGADGRPRAMADAILKVCAMPDGEWRAMSDAAHATANRYTWDDATDLFEAALGPGARDRPAEPAAGRGRLRWRAAARIVCVERRGTGASPVRFVGRGSTGKAPVPRDLRTPTPGTKSAGAK